MLLLLLIKLVCYIATFSSVKELLELEKPHPILLVFCVLWQRVYLSIQFEFPHSLKRCSGSNACGPLRFLSPSVL